MKSYSIGEFSLNNLTVAWRRKSAFRQKTGSCCNFGIPFPICSKFHMYDKGPGLMTSTCKFWLSVIAPPSGNRKCHVVHVDVHLPQKLITSLLKLGEKSLKTLMMLPFENCEFSSNGGAVVIWRISMSRHEKTNRCNSTPDGQILSKLITFDERPAWRHLQSNFQSYS